MSSTPTDSTTTDWASEAAANTDAWQDHIFQEALRLGKLGYRVFPLRRLAKASISTNLCHHAASGSEKTITKWFKPGAGAYAGFNLGLATGGNSKVLVVDLDRKKNEREGTLIDGVQALRELEAANGSTFARTMVSHTPSGGEHLFVAWTPALTHGQNVLAKGVDVRSGGHNYSSGHVVVYPSIVGGKSYQWAAGPILVSDLSAAPDWVSKHTRPPIGERPEWIGDANAGNEQVAPEDLMRPITIEDATAMLEAIPPHDLDYDTWVKIGRAIYSQWPDEVGLALWDAWSAKDAARHQDRDCQSRWVGFTDGRVGIGTLVWIAKQYNWQPSASDEIKIALERINLETPGVLVGGNERWVLTDDSHHISLMSKSATLLYHDIHQVEVGSSNKPKKINPLHLWCSWPGRHLFKRMAMLPPPAMTPPDTYNLWHGFAYQPVSGEVGPWLDFVDKIIATASDREWVHDWLAKMFQAPGSKPVTSLVLRGSEGVGKNTFTDTIGMLFHRSNWTQFEDTEQALSQFNSQMLTAVWLVMNEALWSGNHRHANKIKGLITEPYIAIEKKGVDKFMAPNCSHVVIMTNDDWAVPAGIQSRRFMMIDVPDVLRGNTDFWHRFRDWRSRPESKQALLHWYLNRTITHDLREAPVNDALHRQRVLTKTRDDRGIPADVVAELLIANRAARHRGNGQGQWENAWFWPMEWVREAWSSYTGRNAPYGAGAKVREFVNLVLAKNDTAVVIGLYDREERKTNLVRGILLPSDPNILIEAMIANKLLDSHDVPISAGWEEISKQDW